MHNNWEIQAFFYIFNREFLEKRRNKACLFPRLLLLTLWWVSGIFMCDKTTGKSNAAVFYATRVNIACSMMNTGVLFNSSKRSGGLKRWGRYSVISISILCPRLGAELGGSHGCPEGAFGTDFYDRSTRTIVGTMLWTEYRPVIKIGLKGALGSHEIRPIHSAPSFGQSIEIIERSAVKKDLFVQGLFFWSSVHN